jgi:Phosphotransferase enzyme family
MSAALWSTGQPSPFMARPVIDVAPPDLDRYLDAPALRAWLPTQLPGFDSGALQLVDLRIDSVRRSTSRHRQACPLSLCYHLQVHEPATGRRGTQSLFAQVLRSAAAVGAAAAAACCRLVPPAFGDALVALPDAHLLLWALPNDPELHQLPTLLAPNTLSSRLQKLGLVAGPETLQVELLRHTPADRASLRVTVFESGRSAPRVLHAKTFADGRAALIHQRFQLAWQAAQQDPAAPLVARPLAHDSAWRCLWQAAAPGQPLVDSLCTSAGPQHVALAAAGLAWLHGSALPLGMPAEPHTVAWWLKQVQRRSRKIERFAPERAAAAQTIVHALASTADALAMRPLSLIHGDCHPDQFWIHQGRPVMFDFDEFTLGDPMEDLASGLVRLTRAGQPAALGDAWVQGYAARAPQRYDARSLAWHLTAQSLLQVTRAFIYQQPGWREDFEQRLAVAQRRGAELARGATT